MIHTTHFQAGAFVAASLLLAAVAGAQAPPTAERPPAAESPARPAPEAEAPPRAPAAAGEPASYAKSLRLLRAMDLRGGARESFGDDHHGRIVFWLIDHHPDLGGRWEAQAAAVFQRELSAAEVDEALAIFESPDVLTSPEAANWAEAHRPLIEEQMGLLTGDPGYDEALAQEIACAAAFVEPKSVAALALAEPGTKMTEAFLEPFTDAALKARAFCACFLKIGRQRSGDGFPDSVTRENFFALRDQVLASGECPSPE